MINTLYSNAFRNIAILLGLAMFFSCKPDLKEIENITKGVNLPVETAENVRIIYSVDAKIQMIMEAPLMVRFDDERKYLELPKGFKMTFYDALMNVTSQISANYAIRYLDKEVIDARNDVVVENIENNERLNTEQLIWDRTRGLIYTEKFVKITTQEEVLYGNGFESDEQFNSWIIKNPRGTFLVDMEADTMAVE